MKGWEVQKRVMDRMYAISTDGDRGAIRVGMDPSGSSEPRRNESPDRIQIGDSTAEHTSERKAHVLCVDDDEAIVFITSRLLERLGYRVTGLTHAHMALRQFESSPGEFDIVVTDLSMPGLSGIELASELRRIRPDLPMVLTSGCIRPEDQEMATQLGRTEVIGKPSPPDELDAILRRLLGMR